MRTRYLSTTSHALVLAAVLLAAPRAEAQEARSKQYSIMTYNIGGKPGITGYALDNGSSCEERAAQIGQHILSLPDQPDIVVFMEATGDCYKDGLVKKLNESGPYKAFIYDMGAGSPKFQDSGLMFFSKFPWALPDEPNLCPEMTLVGENVNPVGAPTFGRAEGIFQAYSDLAFSDRMMEKGVGYACVHNPATRQVINVFFTHNQANYWTPGNSDFGDFAHDERTVNMKEASAFINLLAPAAVTSKLGEAVLFAGDMNTFGNDVEYWVNQGDGIDHAGKTEIEAVVTPSKVKGFQEYADSIGPGGLLDQANGLRDPWRVEGTMFPPLTAFDLWGMTDDLGFAYDPASLDHTDMGFTWDALRNGQTDGDQSRARLDYILDRQVTFNRASDCFEHMTVERGFVYTANANVQKAYVGMDLSDHYPLRAVIGPLETFCNPSLAPFDKFGDTVVDVVNGGAKKWFAFSAPGTYVFDATTLFALDVHVFAASDLSTDLVPVEGDTTIIPGAPVGDKRQNDPVTFKVSGPFFVMMAFKDKTITGSFTLSVRKNNCASWDHAEWLTPFEAMHMAMSGAPIGTLQDKCYFKLKQDQRLASGADVEVRALAARMANGDTSAAKAALTLYKADHTPLLAGAVASSSAELSTKLSQSSDVLFLVLERTGSPQQMSFDIVWTRNLTTIDVKKFTVVNQDDDNDGDEVKIFWSIEGASHDPWPVDQDNTTANGQPLAQVTYFYDGLASGASSTAPAVACPGNCFLSPDLADSHHTNIAFPDAMWGIAWEIDDGTPDDALFHDGLNGSKDGRFKITALDPDPKNWIKPGTLDQGAQIFSKNLWADFATYSHGYRLEAVRKL
jgi:hypothetical protein